MQCLPEDFFDIGIWKCIAKFILFRPFVSRVEDDFFSEAKLLRMDGVRHAFGIALVPVSVHEHFLRSIVKAWLPKLQRACPNAPRRLPANGLT